MSVEDLKARLLRLETSSRGELAAEWVKAFGIPAPRKSSREFLLKAVGHHLQTKVYGDLKPSIRKTLLKIAEQIRAGGRLTELPTPKRTLKPGSRLIRAWRGETHEVLVAADGHFEWRGLSAFAFAIARARIPARWGWAMLKMQEEGGTSPSQHLRVAEGGPDLGGVPVRHRIRVRPTPTEPGGEPAVDVTPATAGTPPPRNPPLPKAASAPNKRPAGDYAVGYCRPPASGQFQPGKSGNLKGKKKGSRNAKTIVKELLSEKVTVTLNGKPTPMTFKEVSLYQQVKQAGEGNLKSLDYVLRVEEDSPVIGRGPRGPDREVRDEPNASHEALHAEIYSFFVRDILQQAGMDEEAISSLLATGKSADSTAEPA